MAPDTDARVSLLDLERRSRAAIDRMGRSNPNRALIEDLMTVILNLAMEKRALPEPAQQATGAAVV